MGKRGRKNIGVAGSPKIQGKGNTTCSTDPCNNHQVGVSVKKRKAGDDGHIPAKRMTKDVTNPTQQSSKRKAGVDATPPQKKARCSMHNTTDSGLLEVSSVATRKRKAVDAGDTLKKRKRCSNRTSSLNTASSGCSFVIQVNDDTSDDSGCDISQNSTSCYTEEEFIYEMSSEAITSKADFEEKYEELGLIGAGGFGSVYEGIRKSDFMPVAIKHIPAGTVMWQQVSCNGKVYMVILEVALMLKAAGLPGSTGESAAVSLLDWYLLDQELILVMERPSPCMDLRTYLNSRGGSLDENEAKMILKQLVDAAIDMHSKGVFHRDIKSRNVLVQLGPGAPRVRIIDFGCGTFSTESPCSTFCGTRAFFPPEWFEEETYSAGPTTVWQLGALFYALMSGHRRFTTRHYIEGRIEINPALSTDIKTLLRMCLNTNPTTRSTLEELQLCPTLRHLHSSSTEG